MATYAKLAHLPNMDGGVITGSDSKNCTAALDRLLRMSKPPSQATWLLLRMCLTFLPHLDRLHRSGTSRHYECLPVDDIACH